MDFANFLLVGVDIVIKRCGRAGMSQHLLNRFQTFFPSAFQGVGGKVVPELVACVPLNSGPSA
ncbi:hypothetical protein ES703_113477 [subsurface metagenome]